MVRSWQCHTKQLKCIKDIRLWSSGSSVTGEREETGVLIRSLASL